MRGRAVAALAAVVLAAACSPPSTWLRSRAADLADAVPFSVAYGWGIHASVRATALLELGLTVAPTYSVRWGYEDRTFHGVWGEYQVGLPWIFWADWLEDLPPVPESEGRWAVPLLYRWQAIRDAPGGEGVRSSFYEPAIRSWGRHPPIVRESMGSLIIPQRRRWLEWDDLRQAQGAEREPISRVNAPERATLWETHREAVPAHAAWDLFELDLHLGPFGARLGVRPVEALDFVLGLVLLDPLGDDLPPAVEYEPAPDGEPAPETEPAG